MVFQKLDINQDGVITFEEFIESCLKVISVVISYDCDIMFFLLITYKLFG